MARLQALKQQRFLETSDAPTSSRQVTGGSDGVPKMHPMKSSMPVFKASSMIHALHTKSFGGGGVRGVKGLKLPKLHL